MPQRLLDISTVLFFFFFFLLQSENKAFPPPSPPCNVVLLLTLPVENNKIPQLWMDERDGGRGGWIVLFSEVTLFEYTVSKVLLPIAAQIVQFLNTLDCLESKMILWVFWSAGVAMSKKHNANCRLLWANESLPIRAISELTQTSVSKRG